MAFLDNSGDIILDAVLTDVGRRRMADGNFNITKFALGDDEINYSQYDIGHPSGSAYYDLEILQTPVFESVTSQNSAINYGLLSLSRNNILYLPSILVNQTFEPACQMSGNLFYLAVNQETSDRVMATTSSPATPLGANGEMLLKSGQATNTKFVYMESGINTTDEIADSVSRQNLIVSVNMLDNSFTVGTDVRFINGMFQLNGASPFSANQNSGKVTIPNTVTSAGSSNPARNLTNYVNYTISGVNNLLFTPTAGTRNDPSALSGPRGSGMAMNFSVRQDLRSISSNATPLKFTQFGKTAQTVFGGSDTYDYIDTTVYIRGNASTATAQIPLRIIRYSGS
tara:strand:- start:125 stop:1147 length:1023 start_codon:yes stop_codon:yes gene_type:complete